MRIDLTLAILIFAAVACASGSGSENSDKEEADFGKFQQYQVQGEQLYNKYCAQCHQANGMGLASLYPPLNKSDYLMEDMARAACVISKGAMEEMVVNGTTYNQMMPANPQLSPLQIAEVLTYITNAWDNDAGITNVKDVEKWLDECE